MKLILFLSVFFIFIPLKIKGAIIQVPGDYTTINEACLISSEGDTILIAPGEYEEAITITAHGLTLASNFIIDPDTSYINSTRILAIPHRNIIVIDTTVTTRVSIIGLTIYGSNYPSIWGGTAIDAKNIELSIDYCNIDNNHGTYPAIFIIDGTLKITNSNLRGNNGEVAGLL